jgi:ectoine hydroxylase-related dioxygenase (phytanoyl-CoA dioxygenase family)
MVLTNEQVLSFHLRGFLAIDQPLVDEDELAWMRDVYDRIFEERAGRDTGDQFDLAGADSEGGPASLPQILNPAKYAPELAQGRYLERLNGIARQLFGAEAAVGLAHAILKPAGHGAATPWHQDEAYWDPSYQYQNASIWLPLQEATIDNGCLWFVPGSHEWEVLEHRSIGGDVRVHGLELTNLEPVKTGVPCPLPPGGVTIHRNRTAHYAGPNRTSEPRRALILSTGLPAQPHAGARTFPWNEVKRTARDERSKTATLQKL